MKYVVRIAALLAGLGALAASGCGSSPTPIDGGSDAGPDAGPECLTASDCDDGLACNGTEACTDGRCDHGAPMRCDDGVACTTDSCSEALRGCVHAVPDVDGDGSGDAACVDATGTPLGTDCDDQDAHRFPGNLEVCDAEMHDEDCDASTLGGLDADGDGFVSSACCNGASCGDDCSDARATAYPGATEVCDGVDGDCDGSIDEETTITVYLDADRDGDGDASGAPMQACATTAGFSVNHTDCDDADRARSGRAIEVCDGVDNDCNASIDDDTSDVTWYADLDGDGFGSAASGTLVSCVPPAGYSLQGTDCDDATAARNPSSPEICNAIDDDCSGSADYAIAPGDHEDDDGDGIADVGCGAPLGLDCDDQNPAAVPGAAETCDGRDDDCDGRIDEEATSVAFYRDADRDGYGSAASGTIVACTQPSGFARLAGDCDDGDATRRPGGAEGCNGRDDDCDRAVDEAPASLACTVPHTLAACVGGACSMLGCEPGYVDCSATTTGCETDVRNDRAHCGACGHACGATEYCASGACVAGTLDACGRVVGSVGVPTPCPTLTLTSIADATVDASQPTTALGTSTALDVGAVSYGDSRYVFLRFDLSSIPANTVVLGASLEATAYTGWAYGGDGSVYTQFVQDDTWSEASLTWSSQPTADGVHLGSWWLWYNGVTVENLGVNADAALWPVIGRERDGDQLLSVRLDSPGYTTTYYSREYATAAKRPRLVVGYLPATTVTLEPVADAYVDGTATNHGTAQRLDVDGTGPETTFLRFDLSSIPAGAVIGSATLSMTAFEGLSRGGDGSVTIRFVADDAWTEGGIDGTNAPAPDASALGAWTISYASTSGDQLGSARTAALRDAVDTTARGDQMLSLRLESAADQTHYRSREVSTAALRPRLTIQYVVR